MNLWFTEADDADWAKKTKPLKMTPCVWGNCHRLDRVFDI